MNWDTCICFTCAWLKLVAPPLEPGMDFVQTYTQTDLGGVHSAEMEMTLIYAPLNLGNSGQFKSKVSVFHTFSLFFQTELNKNGHRHYWGETHQVYKDGPDWAKTLGSAGDLNSKFCLG